MKYVVEHLEDAMGEWCALEYNHMLEECGDNLMITNMKPEEAAFLKGKGASFDISESRFADLNLPTDRVCLLDPQAPKELGPDDADAFDYMLFGGILGDDPPRDRTGVLRPLGTVRRHLGPRQMSTDTAVIVCKNVIEDQVTLGEMKFRDDLEVKTGKHDTVLLPYRYKVLKSGNIMMPRGLLKLLKRDVQLDSQLAAAPHPADEPDEFAQGNTSERASG